MGHLGRHGHARLAQRLGQYVPGAFPSETLCAILRVLVTEEEARLLALLPLRDVSAERAAAIWDTDPGAARAVLESAAGKGVVYASGPPGARRYLLAAPVLGFVEFSLMRTDGKFDAGLLSRLYHQYCDVEEDFIRLQGSAHPALARVFAQEAMLGEEVASEVLSWDRVSAGIDAASRVTVGLCFCRTKRRHLGEGCGAPDEVCLTFNDVAAYLADYGIAREISRDEAHRIARDCMERGLVQVGDNKKGALAVICNCCGCCCEVLRGHRRFGGTGLVSPSAFVAAVEAGACTGCGTCAARCPAGAVRLTDGRAVVDAGVCLGCGVCARFCPGGASRMRPRAERPFVPEDLVEKMVMAGIDAGKLGNFLFDDQRSAAHALARRTVNGLLRLPGLRGLLLRPAIVARIVHVARESARAS
ncbi:MAG TPA: 4Fe-4S dicluster domain-containing protein [bacterium]